MNRRGGAGDNVLTWNVSYFILGIAFFVLAFWWIVGLQDGIGRWEDFYAKELAGVIDNARAEQDVWIDVTPATRVGLKNGKSLSEMFVFDNEENSVGVSLSTHSSTRYYFFNNVKVVDVRVEVPSGDNALTSRLHFKILEVE